MTQNTKLQSSTLGTLSVSWQGAEDLFIVTEETNKMESDSFFFLALSVGLLGL